MATPLRPNYTEIDRIIDIHFKMQRYGALVRFLRNNKWVTGRIAFHDGSDIVIAAGDDLVTAQAAEVPLGTLKLYTPSEMLYEARQEDG